MREYAEVIYEFNNIAGNPKAQFEKLLASGKKVIGCLPYFCPEELIYAAGMVPFGIWGADIETSESKRWFPAFICSILHTALDLGISGKYNGMTAVMIPKLCDSLKCMGANWECAIPGIPVINVAHAQNRKIDAGVEFTASQYRQVAGDLARLGGRAATDKGIIEAIELTNKRREAMRVFSRLASTHPASITPLARCNVIKSSYFMEAGKYTSALQELNDLLAALPDEKWDGVRVVTTGVIADSPGLLSIFEENNIMIAGDQIISESVSFNEDVPVSDDPVIGLARRMAAIEGASVLYDPGKQRAKDLVRLVNETKANGVIFIMTKFCDPEEYDYVPVKELLDMNEIPCLLVETDRQVSGFEQARSAIEAFSRMLSVS